MKILVTGMTALQRGPKRRNHIQKLDVPAAIVKAMRDLGHDVDWRGVELGAPLGNYDLQFVALSPLASLGARHGIGGFFRLHHEVPTIIFLDDWKVKALASNFRSAVRNAGYFRRVVFGEPFYSPASAADLEHWEPELIELARRFKEDDWPNHWTLLAPAFAWGDHTIATREVTKRGSLRIDPSYLAWDEADEVDFYAPKNREWMLSILSKIDFWLAEQKLTWPVYSIGNLRTGQERLKTEAMVAEAYSHRWGTLVPAYDHMGSGWFRSRFVYAAAGGSVLVGDPRDLKDLGPSYALNYAMIEELTDLELRNAARAQRARMDTLSTTYDEFVDQVKFALTTTLLSASTTATLGAVEHEMVRA